MPLEPKVINANLEIPLLPTSLCATQDYGVVEMETLVLLTPLLTRPVLRMLNADSHHTALPSITPRVVQSVPRLDPSQTEKRSALTTCRSVLPDLYTLRRELLREMPINSSACLETNQLPPLMPLRLREILVIPLLSLTQLSQPLELLELPRKHFVDITRRTLLGAQQTKEMMYGLVLGEPMLDS